ncbi:MAG: hypothetical protein JXR03_17320 [Cyclobacteriaceae bacterium]
MKKTELDEKVRLTLESLDDLRPAKAPEDFYSKLENRMKSDQSKTKKWIAVLKTGVAAMIVMSLLNGYLLFSKDDTETIASFDDFSSEYFETDTDIIDN